MFAAVIAHSDDASLLTRCITHHLGVGFDRVFVSLNVADDVWDDVHRAQWADDPRVRIAPVEAFSPDPFHYFTFAKDVVMEWVAPEWVAFIDSDEYWLPRTGRMADTAGLSSAEMLTVDRYNAPVVPDEDGLFPETPFPDLELAPLHTEKGVPAPKVLVRPELVVEVGRGAHTCTTTRTVVEGPRPVDLVIAHLPFTTPDRFERKMTKIRRRMEQYGHRFAPGEAHLWRGWLQADAAGLAQEFQDRVLSPGDVQRSLISGELTTARQKLAS